MKNTTRPWWLPSLLFPVRPQNVWRGSLLLWILYRVTKGARNAGLSLAFAVIASHAPTALFGHSCPCYCYPMSKTMPTMGPGRF
ncbi:hypothetical protein BR93DRAFT_569300 [Coniochaeta sp. PMI_546]|nr:hypothetical protein BR93DRAFT_569300 [Coniochaeta sp. PMI_546]